MRHSGFQATLLSLRPVQQSVQPFHLHPGAWRYGSMSGRGGKLDPLLNLNIWRQKGTHIESHLLLLEAKYKNTERFKSRKPRDQIFAPERTFWVNLK